MLRYYWCGEAVLGWGSSGTPAWVDSQKIDEEKRKKKMAQDAKKIKELEEENKILKKRIKQLENMLNKLKK